MRCHPKLWVVILGGLLGLMLMRFAARIFIWLLEKFPRFEISAYLLVIVIGLKLLADWGVNSDWSFKKPDWLAQSHGRLASSPLNDLEDRREGLGPRATRTGSAITGHWLAQSMHKPPPPEPMPEQQRRARSRCTTPHLLDFHSPRRPEFIVFWSLMVICFFYRLCPQTRA